VSRLDELQAENDRLRAALVVTEQNLSSLIAAAHHYAAIMTPWHEAVREALGYTADAMLEARKSICAPQNDPGYVVRDAGPTPYQGRTTRRDV
jgi:hypothetical protein